ncbi:MAG: diguanylate cyclase [Candidatus Omnitrophota bacterium]
MQEDIQKESVFESKILFLTSNAKTKEYIENLLQGEGYILSLHEKSDSLLLALEKEHFDLIIMDLDESINAMELTKKIRSNFLLRHIPIILLVHKNNTIETIKGIYAGADDYIEKPPQAGELLTRIKASLWRAQRDLDANPLTKLPGNASILKELEKRINSNQPFCAAYADLDNFKEYNDYYGFDWGDKIIVNVAAIISSAIKELGGFNDFVGHIGGDDFLFITEPDSVDSVCDKIISDFDASLVPFYKKEDSERGYIEVKDRKGSMRKTPILTISLAIASNEQRTITHTGQIIQIAIELKQYAKSFPRSIYISDRRKNR